MNRDSGTDSANGGWLRRLVRHQSTLHPPDETLPSVFFLLFWVERYLLPPLLPERDAALTPVRELETERSTEPDLLPEREVGSVLCLIVCAIAACAIAAFII
ncbi:MAG: hypothetical protein ACLQU4_20780 [Limisphaerales bacterium]